MLVLSVICFLAAMCFSHLHQGSLQIDSVRYAHIANLLLGGDSWFSLYDEFKDAPYGNKPPLLFWVVAASFKTFGFSTFSAKAPAVLFVFLGLLLLWDLVSRLNGPRAAFFALLLYCGNRVFIRAIADLNFEGMVLMGAVMALRPLVLAARGFVVSRFDAVIYAAGVMLLLQSKPPYLAFIIVPLLVSSFRHPAMLERLPRKLMLPALFVGTILGLSWLAFFSPAVLTKTIDNQLFRPFIMADGYFNNLLNWARVLALDYAPLSWILLLVATRTRVQRGADSSLWLALLVLAIPVVLLSESQSRYLSLPALAGSVLAGEALAYRLPMLRLRHFAFFSFSLCLICFGLFVGIGLPAHKQNAVVELLRVDPGLITQEISICVDGREIPNSRPNKKRLGMLLELEFKKKFTVLSSVELSQEAYPPGSTMLATRTCLQHLETEKVNFVVLRQIRDAAYVKMTSELPKQWHLPLEEALDDH
ncbi:MAG: glycosyltransferase family 39 protein [Oligoflexia bacterium]|nr:glycosyltransferase family 39 protein [Oligoflexia bacterium]